MAKDDEEPAMGKPSETANEHSANPAARLAMVSGHLPKAKASKPPKRPRRNRSGLPDDYSDITVQLNQLRKSASTPNAESRGYVRQRKDGKLWVRERIEKLVDPGTFAEVGSVSGTAIWRQTSPTAEALVDFTPSNNIQGKYSRAHKVSHQHRQGSRGSVVAVSY